MLHCYLSENQRSLGLCSIWCPLNFLTLSSITLSLIHSAAIIQLSLLFLNTVWYCIILASVHKLYLLPRACFSQLHGSHSPLQAFTKMPSFQRGPMVTCALDPFHTFLPFSVSLLFFLLPGGWYMQCFSNFSMCMGCQSEHSCSNFDLQKPSFAN